MRALLLSVLPLSLLVACPVLDDPEDDDEHAGDDEGEGDDGDGDRDDEDGDRDDEDGDRDDEDGDREDEDGDREDDELLSWQELRTVVTDFGCEFEIRGEGVEVVDDELAALCPDCDAIFEIRTDIDTACADSGTTIQVVDPYYRGLVGWGDDAVDVVMITQAPHYDVEDAYLLAEDVDASGGGRMSYSYSGDLGVEDGGYDVDAVFIVD